MEQSRDNQKTVSLKISQEVVATIAGVAALEIEGVSGLAQYGPGMRHSLFSRAHKKTVDVVLSDDFAEIDIGLAIEYGAKINEVCAAVQNAVKDSVQSMTGMAVSKVNIFVADIVFNKETEPEQ